jgi:hypothetical protein
MLALDDKRLGLVWVRVFQAFPSSGGRTDIVLLDVKMRLNLNRANIAQEPYHP